MTSEEKQEIISAILSSIRTNSRTIAQLTPVTSLSDSDSIEIAGGKRVTIATLRQIISASVIVNIYGIKGWITIEDTSELPEEPTTEQVGKAFVLADESTMYIYVGEGGDALDGKYKSLNMKGADGGQGPAGADGHDGVDLGLVNLVNNLTEGGEGSALTAEMGKELGQLVARVDDMDVVYPELLKRLPSGYTALDYIDNGSAGSGAVLDTGIVPNADDYRFVGSWRRTGTASSSTSVISAASNTSYGQYKIIRNSSNDGSLKVCAYNKSTNATTVTLVDSGTTAWHNYDLRVGKIVLDGVETALSTTTTGQLASSMLLGDVNYPQQIGRFLVFKGDVLLAAFQPCKNASDVYGMYDLVGEQFYGSSNTNAFSGGNEALMPADKVVSGGILQTAIENSKDVIEKSLIGGDEVIPANSRLNADTTITDSAAGGWQRIHTTYNLERASDGVGLRINSSDKVAWGIKYPALLAGYSSTDRFCITFEARCVNASTQLPSIDIFLNEDYVNDFTPAIQCTLSNEWQRFVFTNIKIGDGGQGGQMSINCTKHAGTSTFEIRNLSVLKAAPVTEVEDEVEQLGAKVVDNILRGKKVSIMGDSISTFEDADNGIYNAREFTVLASDITNNRTLQGYPTYYDIGVTIGGVEVTSAMVGVLTSFTPVSGDEGKSIGKPLNRNSTTIYDIVDIWWYRLVTELGGNVLQNVSWSGASMCSHEGNANELKTSYAWHDAQINKLATRDADGNTVNPDVVIIYRGTNDMTHSPYAKLTDYGAGSMTVPSDDTVTDGYGFKEAYVKTIEKIRAKYPNAFIICCTLNVFKRLGVTDFPMNNGTNTWSQFNNAIREVADMMGCGLIEFDKDGITMENCYPTFINDSSTSPTHPNPKGHRMMALKAIADVRKM